ncbi:nitroreductase/quinone reductase family protein [Streptomyces griseoincarnatus]|uniref:nitroreductase/quinone reductase family protein n=1 Tax=Promicromonospora sp. NPDC057138 TaxID=3346031 RepID=UPI0036417CCA
MSNQHKPIERQSAPQVPPRWFVHTVWALHRALYRITAGRVGLRRPRARSWGTLRVITTGRRTGCEHSVIIAYIEDDSNLVALAMNGWADGDPDWWLNLQAHPEATVELADGSRFVVARAAQGEERDRLWARWQEIDANLDGYAALRSTETVVVVMEPRPEPPHVPHGVS